MSLFLLRFQIPVSGTGTRREGVSAGKSESGVPRTKLGGRKAAAKPLLPILRFSPCSPAVSSEDQFLTHTRGMLHVPKPHLHSEGT